MKDELLSTATLIGPQALTFRLAQAAEARLVVLLGRSDLTVGQYLLTLEEARRWSHQITEQDSLRAGLAEMSEG
jgi:hypothetical protein